MITSKKISPYLIPGVRIKAYTPEAFMEDICSFFNVTIEELRSSSRKIPHRIPRQVFMSEVVEVFKYSHNISYKKAAEMVNRDHATLIHSKRAVKNIYDTEKSFRDTIDSFREMIKDKISIAENKDDFFKNVKKNSCI